MYTNTVAVGVINQTNEPIYVNKNSVLASFRLCDNSYDVYYMSCANMCVQEDNVVRDTKEPDLGMILGKIDNSLL